MKNFRLLVLLSMSLLLSSCYDPEVKGRLVLSKTVNMFRETEKKPVPVEVAAGEYKAIARLRDQNRSLYLQIIDNHANPNIKFELPVRFPDAKGEFRVTPKECRQPYGLHGIVRSQSQDSSSVTKWETCINPCVGGGGLPFPSPGCSPSGNGYQKVRYHIRTTQTHYDVNLEAADGTSAGVFTALSEYSEKIYEYKGICM
jgi:hypothetical protein